MSRQSLSFALLLALPLAALDLPACVDDSGGTGGGGEGGDPSAHWSTGGAGGDSGAGGSGATGNSETVLVTFQDEPLNQCGVAAPGPADVGSCTTVSSPVIVDFDDYEDGPADSYAFHVGGESGTPGSVLGGLLHIDDGSDGATITTEMVAGADGSPYAIRIASDDAQNWGGLLMLYFPSGGDIACLDGSEYAGIELSLKGSSPSGNAGVTLGMVDTNPTADGGLCDNASSDDCKEANVQVALPEDPEKWSRIQIPWSAFVPGMGSDGQCIPANGMNLMRLVVQPYMVYAPPTWEFSPGAYSLTIDSVRFYGTRNASGDDLAIPGGACDFPESIQWTSTGPIISPESDETHSLKAVKDPSIVRYGDEWHVFASSVSTTGAYNLVYTSFADFADAPSAPLYYLDATPGFDTYVAAPEVFYFTPTEEWYLVYQSGPPMYSKTTDITDPTLWSAPTPFYSATPDIVEAGGGGWLDYWVICDDAKCHLFFSSNEGRYYRAETSIDDFPEGFGEPEIVFEHWNSGRIFEGSNVYAIDGTGKYLILIEAFDQTSNDHRYYRSWVGDSLEGPWYPWQSSGSFPFAGPANVTFESTAWTADISHGEMIRSGYDQTLGIDPCNLRYIYQGADPEADNEGDYNKIPWNLGLLTQVE